MCLVWTTSRCWPRVGQLVLRNVPRGQLLVIGPRVGLVSRVEKPLLISRVDSFSLLAPAWGSSPTWSSSLLMSRVDSFSLLAPAWGDSFVDVPRGWLLVVSSRVEQFVRLPLGATR